MSCVTGKRAHCVSPYFKWTSKWDRLTVQTEDSVTYYSTLSQPYALIMVSLPDVLPTKCLKHFTLGCAWLAKLHYITKVLWQNVYMFFLGPGVFPDLMTWSGKNLGPIRRLWQKIIIDNFPFHLTPHFFIHLIFKRCYGHSQTTEVMDLTSSLLPYCSALGANLPQ